MDEIDVVCMNCAGYISGMIERIQGVQFNHLNVTFFVDIVRLDNLL